MPRLRYLTAGESHGEMLTGIIDGIPSGLELVAEQDIDPVLAERQKGYGRGRRQQIEQDRARITGGVRFGLTTGGPISLLIENKDWANWTDRMSVQPASNEKPVTIPRPGHIDLAGAIKYGHEADVRNAFERASARETAMRVALGAIAMKLLAELNIQSIAYVQSVGLIRSAEVHDPFPLRATIAGSPLRTPDARAAEEMMALIDLAKANGDTLGGTVVCVVSGLPIGVGSHVQSDRKLDGLLAEALMSIQAVKGVEIGAGFRAAHSFGSEVHDALEISEGAIRHTSNNAGGLEGGVTNGEDLIVTVAMKPISTLMRPLNSIDLATGEPALAHIERSDVCAVPALSVIVEAVTALVLADAILDTFGGDTVDELRSRVHARRDRSMLTNLKQS